MEIFAVRGVVVAPVVAVAVAGGGLVALKETIAGDAYGQFNIQFSDYVFESQDQRNAYWDAFRHTYTSGRFNMLLGKNEASELFVNLLGHVQEWARDLTGTNNPADKNMDLWNNEIGWILSRTAIDANDLAQKVYASITASSPITINNNLDTRSYAEYEFQFDQDAIKELLQLPTLLHAEDDPNSIGGRFLDALSTQYQQLLGQFDLIRTIRDPLVVDLNGDGRATVVDSHVYFDLDSDGAFSEAVHLWAAPQDGMIVVDLNNNGRADSGAELFSDVSAWNALRAYDLNGDHIINASDAVWTQLHVWQDKNADGATQADEWFSMDALGISAITPPSVGETGSITTTTGTSVVTAYNFTTDTRNTIYTGDTEVDFATLFLPALRGYATLPDLRAAMSLDNTGTDSLLNNVATLAAVNDNAPLLLTGGKPLKIAA